MPKEGGGFSFPAPSAAALHLNAAWRAARRANALRQTFSINVFVDDKGKYVLQAAEDTTAPLFDYFEDMITTAFGSFGAIEAYCNQLIMERATGPLS